MVKIGSCYYLRTCAGASVSLLGCPIELLAKVIGTSDQFLVYDDEVKKIKHDPRLVSDAFFMIYLMQDDHHYIVKNNVEKNAHWAIKLLFSDDDLEKMEHRFKNALTSLEANVAKFALEMARLSGEMTEPTMKFEKIKENLRSYPTYTFPNETYDVVNERKYMISDATRRISLLEGRIVRNLVIPKWKSADVKKAIEYWKTSQLELLMRENRLTEYQEYQKTINNYSVIANRPGSIDVIAHREYACRLDIYNRAMETHNTVMAKIEADRAALEPRPSIDDNFVNVDPVRVRELETVVGIKQNMATLRPIIDRRGSIDVEGWATYRENLANYRDYEKNIESLCSQIDPTVNYSQDHEDAWNAYDAYEQEMTIRRSIRNELDDVRYKYDDASVEHYEKWTTLVASMKQLRELQAEFQKVKHECKHDTSQAFKCPYCEEIIFGDGIKDEPLSRIYRETQKLKTIIDKLKHIAKPDFMIISDAEKRRELQEKEAFLKKIVMHVPRPDTPRCENREHYIAIHNEIATLRRNPPKQLTPPAEELDVNPVEKIEAIAQYTKNENMLLGLPKEFVNDSLENNLVQLTQMSEILRQMEKRIQLVREHGYLDTRENDAKSAFANARHPGDPPSEELDVNPSEKIEAIRYLAVIKAQMASLHKNLYDSSGESNVASRPEWLIDEFVEGLEVCERLLIESSNYEYNKAKNDDIELQIAQERNSLQERNATQSIEYYDSWLEAIKMENLRIQEENELKRYQSTIDRINDEISSVRAQINKNELEIKNIQDGRNIIRAYTLDYQTTIVSSLNKILSATIRTLFPEGNVNAQLLPNGRLEITSPLINNFDWNSLSGGEKSRVSICLTIAFANVYGMPFIMLDETTTSLDSYTASEIIRCCKRYIPNTICLYIEHDSNINHDEIVAL